jgi:hypothetical protein
VAVLLGCRESARGQRREQGLAPGVVEGLSAAGLHTIAGIRTVGKTPLTLAITNEEGAQAIALRFGSGPPLARSPAPLRDTPSTKFPSLIHSSA